MQAVPTLAESQLIQILVELGQGKWPSLEAIAIEPATLRRLDEMYRYDSTWWEHLFPAMQTDAMEALVRGLVLARGRSGLLNSVSPVIWAYRALQSRQDCTELADWVLANTDNEYEPFGSIDLLPASRTNLK